MENNQTETNQTGPAKNKSSDHLYLEKLEFNPELRKTWLNFFVTNFRVVVLMIILLTIMGVYSFLQLPRESNPEVKIPIAVVAVSYPGVGPSDVEELVTKKIETSLSSLKDIKKITSNSGNSLSVLTVEFEASANLTDSIRGLRDQVNSIKSSLPAETTEPIVKEISFDDTPIWSVAITGPYDGFTMRQYANDIKDELEKINGVREIRISGGDEREFLIAYDPDKLNFYGMSADQVNQSIKASNLIVPAGVFEGKEFTYPVRTDNRFFDAAKFAALPVGHSDDGSLVLLRDLARVEDHAIKHTILSRLSSNGQPSGDAITIQLIKKTGGNIINTVNQANQVVNAKVATFKPGVKTEVIVNLAKQIETDFHQLIHDFLITLLLVIAILFLIVGLKEAFVAGLAVPLVFFIAFGVMSATGISLNFLSIFSLILSLGLLVDDAIVVVSATKQYLKTGKFTPEEAVLLVLNDFKVVLTTTTLTTIWAFLPLLMSTGIIGSFIKSIPITVSVTLFASLLVALMINHPLAAVLERIRLTKRFFWIVLLALISVFILTVKYEQSWIGYIIATVMFVAVVAMVWWYRHGGKNNLARNAELVAAEWRDDDLIKLKLKTQGNDEHATLSSKLIHGIIHFNAILPWYERWLRRFISTAKRRRLTIGFAMILFVSAILLPITGVVPTEFFPASNQDVVYINLRSATGLNLAENDKIVRQVEEKLYQYPDIINFSTIVGTGGSSGGGASSGVVSSKSNLANFTVNLKPKNNRITKSYELAEKIRGDLASVQGTTITVDAPRGGPPSGAAFQAQISGEDLQQLDQIAQDLQPKLASITGVTDTDVSLKESPAEYTFKLDPAKLELYNLNAAYVGSTLRMAIAGLKVSTVIKGGKEIVVNAEFAAEKIPDLSAIQNLQIVNLRKQPVYIKDVATVELKPSVDSITRIDQKRTVTLTAGVSANTRPNEVVSQFQSKVTQEYKLPEGYVISYGGENEQNTESVLSILRAMILAMLLIVSTLIIQFNSFKKAIIVLVTIPLALIGVFYGMAVAGVALSFPGLIGVLALFGIVVKNAIILVDKINLNLKSGIPFEESIVDAGKSRLEAIFITSICTIFGILPITLSNETWMSLGSAIIFGLMLSSFLTLFIVPTLFRSWIKPDEQY
ncbi:MAG: efflux RND transporter permease subunit [Candidatus Falkowbacteria bacterium]